MDELDILLDGLPNSKAAGIDNVPNELLKNSSITFRIYLITFLNKILEVGEVPQELNVGKCMLVYKVFNLIGHELGFCCNKFKPNKRL